MINREGAPQGSGENSDDTKAGFFANFFGRKAFTGFEGDEGESAENNTVENSLDGVTAAIRRLGDNAASRNFGNFSKLVGAADLPEETKQRLLDEYEDGDDFDTLVEALSNRAGENKEAKRASLIERLKPKLARTAVIGVAAAVLVGAGTLLYRGLKANDNVSASTEAPVKIATEQFTEDAVDDATEEEVSEESILDDESLYTNSNYENFDLDEIGEAVVEHYIDAGEGYEVSENGIQANFSDYNDFENKSSHNAFGKKISDEAIEALEAGDSKMYVDELMTKFVNNPAIASAHISMIEPAMDALEVPDEIKSISGYGERAQAVWNWVREQGGEKNEEVMGALFVSLKAETTEFQVETRSGTDWTMYETVKNTTEQMSIENALLMGQGRIERDDAIQVKTILHFVNSEGEEIEVEFTDNTECGVQPTGKVIIRNKTTNIIITIDIPVDDDHEQEQEEQEQEQTQTEVITQNTQEEQKTNDTNNKTAEVESEVTEEISKTPETSETPASDTTKAPEESSEEEESGSAVIKTKDAESLVQGVNQALTDAGSNNVVTQTPVIDANASTSASASIVVPGNDGNNVVVSTVVSNDGTSANLNNGGQVVSVTDGKTGDVVAVTTGDKTATYDKTDKTDQQVADAVNEGKVYVDTSDSDDGDDGDNDGNGGGGGNGEDNQQQQQQQQIANENQEADELMQLLNNS